MKAIKTKHEASEGFSAEAGFSIIELMLGMFITLVLSGLAMSLLVSSFNIRARENQTTSALSDAQRALNIMTREIANAGFGLSNNGIVAAESGPSAIRFRANLNALDGETTSGLVSDSNEDVKFTLFSGAGQSYVERVDVNTGARTTVLANRVDALRIYYFADKVDYTSGDCLIAAGANEVIDKTKAKYLVIVVCVELPPRGAPGSPGYQPASQVQLVSDVMLRNSDLPNY
jgi:type II secretory pathway pseudopilin PulG